MENVNQNEGCCGTPSASKCCKTTIYAVAIIGSFLLVAFLVKQMIAYTHTAPVGAERGVARAADNAVIRAAGTEALKSWGYVDQAKGIVRVPVDEAMKLTVLGYQKPAAFRSDLVARVEKATAPGPKPPEKKNEFE